MNEIISVIIPVYKVEKYLNRCIVSVVGQTYKNIEIILVDDGSPDICPKICDEWKKMDKRIKVIHKENGGLSDARNVGLSVATGYYISFIDSDDWIDKTMYYQMLSFMKKYDADIIECAFKKTDKYISKIKQPEMKVYEFDSVTYQRKLFDSSEMASIASWNKIYRKELFNDLKFPKGRIHEDLYLTPKISLKCKKIVSLNQKYYYYYQSNNSITRSGFNKRRLDVLYSFEENRNLYLKNNLNDLVEWCDLSYSFHLIKNYNLSLIYLDDKNIAKKIKRCFDARIKYYLKNSHVNYKQKILLLLFYINPKIYSILLKIINN